jgi:hypothetical protein
MQQSPDEVQLFFCTATVDKVHQEGNDKNCHRTIYKIAEGHISFFIS